MCEQCSAETVTYGELLPGFALVRATRKGRFMEPGQWGLVESNDPFFVFGETPTPDPTHGMTDDEIDASPDDHPMWAWIEVAGNFAESLHIEPEVGHRLVEAAKSVGFVRERDASFGFWLFHRMGDIIEKNPNPQRGEPHA